MAPPSDTSPSGHSAIAIQAIQSPSTAQPTAQAAQGAGPSAHLSNAPFTCRADANESGQGPLSNTANTLEQAFEQEPLAASPAQPAAALKPMSWASRAAASVGPAPRAAIPDAFASPSPSAQKSPPGLNNSRFFDGVAIREKLANTMQVPPHQQRDRRLQGELTPDEDMASPLSRHQRHHDSSPDQHSGGRGQEDGQTRRSREGGNRHRSRDGGSNKRQRSGSRSKDQGYRERRDRPSESAYESFERRRSRSRDYREERQYKRKDSRERHTYHGKSDYGHNERQHERYRARSRQTEEHKPEPGSAPKVSGSDMDALIKEVQEEAAKKVASLFEERDRRSRQPSPQSKTGRDSTLPRHKEYESKPRRDIEQGADTRRSRDERSKVPPKQSAPAKSVELLSNNEFPGTECGKIVKTPTTDSTYASGLWTMRSADRHIHDDWYFLIHARHNKPPIRSDVDIRSITRAPGSDVAEFPWTYEFSMKQDSRGFLKGYQSSVGTLRNLAWLTPRKIPSQIHPSNVESIYTTMKDDVSRIKKEIQKEAEERCVKFQSEKCESKGLTPNEREKFGLKPGDKEGLNPNKRQRLDSKPGEEEGLTPNKRQKVDTKGEEDKVTADKGGGSD